MTFKCACACAAAAADHGYALVVAVLNIASAAAGAGGRRAGIADLRCGAARGEAKGSVSDDEQD